MLYLAACVFCVNWFGDVGSKKKHTKQKKLTHYSNIQYQMISVLHRIIWFWYEFFSEFSLFHFKLIVNDVYIDHSINTTPFTPSSVIHCFVALHVSENNSRARVSFVREKRWEKRKNGHTYTRWRVDIFSINARSAHVILRTALTCSLSHVINKQFEMQNSSRDYLLKLCSINSLLFWL